MPRVENPFGGKTRSEFMQDFWKDPVRGATRRAHVREANARRATTQLEVFPLASRGARVEEIMHLRELPRDTIESAIQRLRENKDPGRRLLRPTPETSRELHRKAIIGLSQKDRTRVYTPDQLNSFVFARKLVDEGFVTDDLSNWNFLTELYERNGRQLPGDFPDKLRLEVFLAAQENPDLLASYQEAGNAIDPEWFGISLQAEEQFIATRKRDKILLAIFHKDPSLVPHDELGKNYLYDLYQARRKWVQTGDRSFVSNFPTTYEEQDPTIIERLQPAIKVVWQATPIQAKPRNGDGDVVYGEVTKDELGLSDI